MKYKIKPALVDAIRNDGDDEFLERLEKFDEAILVGPGRTLVIRSSLGDVCVPVGWWVIKISDNKYWTCADTVFYRMFEKL